MAKRLLFILCLSMAMLKAGAQKVDSLYFNLYTDSLKKGTYNYINVEGRFSDGRYLPLGEKELKFAASGGSFRGNSLFIDTSFKEERVKVKVSLLSDASLTREIWIYIKKAESNEHLPTVDEIMRKPVRGKRA